MVKEKLILGTLFLLLISITTAQADMCVDQNTLQYTFPYEDDSGSHIVRINKTCPDGCKNDRCIDESPESGMMFVLGVLGIAALFFYVAFKFSKEEHGYLQTLFFMLGLLMILVLIWIMFNYAVIAGHPAMEEQFTILLSVVMWIIIFMIGYILILLMNNTVKHLMDRNKRGSR